MLSFSSEERIKLITHTVNMRFAFETFHSRTLCSEAHPCMYLCRSCDRGSFGLPSIDPRLAVSKDYFIFLVFNCKSAAFVLDLHPGTLFFTT